MNAVLICPASRPAVEHLSTLSPLAAIPLLGESLVEYWLAHLALSGATRVRLLASDRPEHIAAIVGDGARWGLKATVVPETRELTAAQAQIKYAGDITAGARVTVLDHFPGSLQSLFTCYADWFAGIFEWLPNAIMPDRVGLREVRPGIWTGWHSRVSPAAQLHPPCWIGRQVYIGAGAVIGPMAVIEDRSFIDAGAGVVSSLVGPDTYVGQGAVIQQALAWGDRLINWKTNHTARVTEPFVLSALRPAGPVADGVLERLTRLCSRNKEEFQAFWKQFLLNKEDKLSTHDKL